MFFSRQIAFAGPQTLHRLLAISEAFRGEHRQPVRYRTALITGATSGIGAAFGEALPPETMLLLTGRRSERLAASAARLTAQGRTIHTLAADLSSASGRIAVIEWARGFGVDLLICNAGLGKSGRFIETFSTSHRETVEVNILAPLEILDGLLPTMIATARKLGRRCGVIIVSSTAAFGPRPGMACYAASKAFLLRLGQALAMELRDQPVDLLVLCPTYTSTEFFARADLPVPRDAMTPDAVAREGLAALGRRTVHLCGRRYQPLDQFFAFNPSLAIWRWPRRLRLSHRFAVQQGDFARKTDRRKQRFAPPRL